MDIQKLNSSNLYNSTLYNSNLHHPNENTNPQTTITHLIFYSFLALLSGFFIEVIFRVLDRTAFIDYPVGEKNIILLILQIIVVIFISAYLIDYFAATSTNAELLMFSTFFLISQSIFIKRFEKLSNKVEDRILYYLNI